MFSCNCNLSFPPSHVAELAVAKAEFDDWNVAVTFHPAIGTCTAEVEFRWVVVSPTYFAWRITRLEGFQRYEKSIPSWRNVVDDLNETWLNYIKWAMKKVRLFKGIEGIMLTQLSGDFDIPWVATYDETVGGRPGGLQSIFKLQGWFTDQEIWSMYRIYSSDQWQDQSSGMRLWMRWGVGGFLFGSFFFLGWGGAGVLGGSKSWGTDSAEGVGALGLSYILHVQNVVYVVWNMNLSVISNENLRPSLGWK